MLKKVSKLFLFFIFINFAFLASTFSMENFTGNDEKKIKDVSESIAENVWKNILELESIEDLDSNFVKWVIKSSSMDDYFDNVGKSLFKRLNNGKVNLHLVAKNLTSKVIKRFKNENLYDLYSIFKNDEYKKNFLISEIETLLRRKFYKRSWKDQGLYCTEKFFLLAVVFFGFFLAIDIINACIGRGMSFGIEVPVVGFSGFFWNSLKDNREKKEGKNKKD